jgi:septal ring factor EnvC (AmiA/AmiB activator)
MKTKEEIFHNKLVHYNPTKFPNEMKKCIYNAMQEYADQQTKELKEQLAEANERVKYAENGHELCYKELTDLREQLSQKEFELKAADHVLAEKEKEIESLLMQLDVSLNKANSQ